MFNGGNPGKKLVPKEHLSTLIKAFRYTVLYLFLFVQFSNTFLLHIQVCNGVIQLVAGWFNSLTMTFKKSLWKMNRKSTSRTKASEKVDFYKIKVIKKYFFTKMNWTWIQHISKSHSCYFNCWIQLRMSKVAWTMFTILRGRYRHLKCLKLATFLARLILCQVNSLSNMPQHKICAFNKKNQETPTSWKVPNTIDLLFLPCNPYRSVSFPNLL